MEILLAIKLDDEDVWNSNWGDSGYNNLESTTYY